MNNCKKLVNNCKTIVNINLGMYVPRVCLSRLNWDFCTPHAYPLHPYFDHRNNFGMGVTHTLSTHFYKAPCISVIYQSKVLYLLSTVLLPIIIRHSTMFTIPTYLSGQLISLWYHIEQVPDSGSCCALL